MARNGISQQLQQQRVPHSMPSSPQGGNRPISFEVVGSAESLVGRVLAQQGLGKYCDPDFVAKEMQEALDMTSEEMDMAAHILLQTEKEQFNQNPKAPPRNSRNTRDKL
jgi:voltage-dependent calcium channel L type alpha-1D